MTSVVTTGKVGSFARRGPCYQTHRTAGFSVSWARRKHMCCPPDWGRYRTPSTLRRASRGMRFGEMRVLSQVFVIVWAAEPQLPGARQGHRGRCKCCSRPVEHGFLRAKSVWRHRLGVVERGAFCGCAARRLGVAGAVRRRDQCTTWTVGSGGANSGRIEGGHAEWFAAPSGTRLNAPSSSCALCRRRTAYSP